MDQRERIAEFQESIRAAILGFLANTWTAMPGIVQSVNLQRMTVTVQPTIQGQVRPQTGDPAWKNMPILVDVPILFPTAGGFALTLPIKKGDEVLIVFASRCIDGWWQQSGIQNQPELRMHDLADGFAIPGPKSLPNVIPSISANTAQLRTMDGTAYIELTSDGKVNIVAPGGVKITGDVEITGSLTVDDDLTVDGDVSVSGQVTVTGEGTFNGGHTVSAHKHGGVQTGSGQTATPTG